MSDISLTNKYKEQVRRLTKMSEDEFELITSQIMSSTEMQEDRIEMSTHEDTIIDALHVNLAKSFNGIYPRKTGGNLPEPGMRVQMDLAGDERSMMIYCMKHKERSCAMVCVNSSCKSPFLCMKCFRGHYKICDRNSMVIPVGQVLDLKVLDMDNFNPSEFDYSSKIQRVHDLVQTTRDKSNRMLDLIERNAINKLCHESKEFKMQQMRKIIDQKVQNFRGKTHQTNPLSEISTTSHANDTTFSTWTTRTSSPRLITRSTS